MQQADRQEMVRIDSAALRGFIADLFVKAGLTRAQADVEAQVLTWADMRGAGSHGVLRVPSYLAAIARKKRNAEARPRAIVDRGCMAVVEAERGPGLAVMRDAMDDAIARARAHGLGWVLVRNTTHTGAMGFYVRQATAQGMMGVALCSSRPLMAYYGTRDGALGTAPIAIAAPRKGAEPLVLDMASAAISIGALAQAQRAGATLAPDVALDADGRVTRDAREAVTPLPMAGPKGAGLGLMIECLTSLLVGLPLLSSAFENPAERADYIQNALVVALDPSAFGTHDFPAEVDRLARNLASLPRAAGFDEILMPGERGDREYAHSLAQGVALPASLWRQLAGEGVSRGLTPPSPL